MALAIMTLSIGTCFQFSCRGRPPGLFSACFSWRLPSSLVSRSVRLYQPANRDLSRFCAVERIVQSGVAHHCLYLSPSPQAQEGRLLGDFPIGDQSPSSLPPLL